MKPVCLVTLLVYCCMSPLLAQQRLADILTSSNNYEEIVKRGEDYFRKKYPTTTFKNLTQGEHRDGEFVKFMRWRSFWEHRLNPDGTLGDVSAYWREQEKQPNVKTSESPYKDVSWTNVSYTDYIVSQIGLGRTTSIGFHPTDSSTFYVGAAIGGIWKTTDGGQSYTPLGDELPFMAVSSIIIKKNDASRLFIAVSDHVWYGPPGIGVYKSIDGGETWQPTALNFKLSNNIIIYWMEADPVDPNKMFVATSDGLYRTTDEFQTVTKINSISSFDVKIHPSNSNIVYQGGNRGEFLRSTDGGSTFSQIEDFGDRNVYIATTPLNPSKVYARHGLTLYKSTDSGLSFPNTNTLPIDNSVLAFSLTDENILLAGFIVTNRSDNDGASFYATSKWEGEDDLPIVHVDQRNIFTNPLEPDYVYYCNDGGVYRYVVSTNSFQNLCNGLMITQFYDIAVSQTDKNIISAGSQDNGNVFRDSNGTWYDYAPTGDGTSQEIDPTDANIRYWSFQNGSLQRWESGINTAISPPDKEGQGAWETPFRLDPNNPSHIVVGYDRVYSSTDKGTTWTDISGDIFGGNLDEIAIAKSNSNRIYAARGNQLFVKNISNNNWVTKYMPVTVPRISDLEVDPFNMNIIYISVPGFMGGSKVFKSTDAGTTWTNISGTLPNVSVDALELYETIPNAIFIGTDAGVYYRDDSFADWQLYGKIPHTRVEDIEIQYAEKLIRIGTHGRGVLEAPIVIETCNYGDPDADNDGVCDAKDACPDFPNNLIGTPCDDGDPFTTGETWSTNCECEGGVANLSYCAAEGSVGTTTDWIERVSLHTLDYSSGFSAYSDFRSQSTTLEPGGTYTLTIDLYSSFPLDKVYAWIDYDRDGIFEPSELITMSGLDANHASTGIVNVPANVGMGATTMRVRSLYDDPNTAQPCGNYYGEVEDYTIYFTYCAARGTLGTGSDWISRVKLNTIDNSSIQTYYSDFKHLSTDLVRGGSYPIEVTLNHAFPENTVYVWIDYNQDGTFEASERITLPAFTTGSNTTSTGTINVPANALPGKTIMRVRSQFDDPNDPQACGNDFAGEVEDYTINITYCAAAGTAGTGGDYINRVTLNTLNNTSGETAYSDFKHLSTDLIRGASYPIEVQMQYNFDIDSVYVWIDFDKDGVFEDSEQTIMSKPTPLQYNQVSTGIVTVPADAIQGKTVMRVRTIYANPNTAQACGDFFGEVEDYTVNLIYCAAAGAEGTGGDWINKVSLNTINHTSGKTAYSNFKAISTTLRREESYNLEVSLNSTLPFDKVYAWIDYDQNGAFTASESIPMSAIASLKSQGTGTINVPANAPLGATTMRVRVLYADPNPADPCGNYFGEVEDYTIIIEDACVDSDNDTVCDDEDVCLGYSDVPLVLTTNPSTNGEYKAVTTLQSSVTINSGLNISYKAGTSITLKPGFHAKAGSTFSAVIQNCVINPLVAVDERQAGEDSTAVEAQALAKEIVLEPDLKIFPNPFSDVTNIAYSLPESSPVHIFLADARGRIVATLLDTKMQEAGSYQLQWQRPANFSGMLFLHFRTDKSRKFSKLVLTK